MKKLFSILLLAVAASSCSMRDKIRVTSDPEVRVESASRMVVSVGVENRSRHNIRIVDGKFRLHTPGGDIATALLPDEVVIPRRSAGVVELPLRVRFNNPLAILGNVLGGGGNVLISGEAVARVGAARKKLRVENRPVSEFLDSFAK